MVYLLMPGWVGSETVVPALLGLLLTLFFMRRYLKKLRVIEESARHAAEQGAMFSEGPQAQHPLIDESRCIGCGTCSTACPEGDVLGIIGGKAAIVKPYKCIGHGFCAEACPVGAITMTTASPRVNSQLPRLTPEYETNLPNLFIIGELGGLALIKNAVTQGRQVIDVVFERLQQRDLSRHPDAYDVVIVGAGPAGISASLRAIEQNLNYLTLEEGEIGGTVARYPRQKLVMTSPVDFPIYGRFNRVELSKEELVAFWSKVMHRADFKARTGEKVLGISLQEDGRYCVTSSKSSYKARSVILALGKSGTPTKLEVPGENLPKVMYRLIEVDHYRDSDILVVGGGDSAVEAAMGLAAKGNRVTISYRKTNFNRIKERNAQRIAEFLANGKLNALCNSRVLEIRHSSVLLEQEGTISEIPNHYVWIFAGGTPPYDFLKEIGVSIGTPEAVQPLSALTP
ncbi:4Fe-4S ferredoxin, iron-sulfur binding protein [Candidatus Koribacter versatilis Ellin345]|uniref:4Fe-4S ferredoxin, iron-sulfur binding protein n=1 Tax=Koribacter versatilis (strain Ellin345) TaxID=204669 RepID=Q1IUG9_KORVE|nr:4Fe-4S ferredoxin, iron-sulfur binding protein [Candidatus Koribacter versatilis Ellin345]